MLLLLTHRIFRPSADAPCLFSLIASHQPCPNSLFAPFLCLGAGEGIHTAMMGGKAAAEVLLACREAGDYSRRSTRLYERRWMELFGHDFKLVGW